ncbi:DUF5694 domain-containing protein [Spirosoma foliorum]|uniref:TraB/GumN family protein n=1 Tax=Spirosoma foliorum TaxID=2710596 RepID=A0A7G5GX23_9BACT|nr:DUF5694 domain-containing protein [Spirosoma foliorum]QMW03382.1 hypothetical protein H3H32_36975 [Spirosoma foliorum]QMW03415.1 hypothetical protein H3H32_00135 [Spirosoma foliorum]
MKLLISFFLIIISFLASAQSNKNSQPLEILFIAAAHDYGAKPIEDFSYPINKALAFKPDAVFGENLSPEDYDALDRHWNKEAIDKRLAYLTKIGYPLPKHPQAFIARQYKLLRKYPYYHQERMKLAHALYLTHDFGNASYQFYLLDKLRPAFGAEEIAAFTQILGPVDSLKNVGFRRSNEYYNIFHPIAQSLKLDKIMPMDCQKYNTPWSAAWEKTDSLYKLFEKGIEADTNSADYKTYLRLNTENNELQRLLNKANQAGKSTAFLNTADWDKYTDFGNFYGNRYLFGLKNFPEEGVRDMLKYWTLRNEGMCQNIVDRARKIGAKRVVVGVGASHRELMVKLLKEMPGVTVYTLNEYQP